MKNQLYAFRPGKAQLYGDGKKCGSGIDHLVIPRYTRVINNNENKDDINAAYSLISVSTVRNQQIQEDIQSCVKQGRTPVILTRYKEHARLIYESIREAADYVFLLYGDNSAKENEAVRMQLKEVPRDKTLILVATGQKSVKASIIPGWIR